MELSVGTFNLNNLFSRWNFTGAVQELADTDVESVTVRYEFSDSGTYRLRTFAGRLVRPKSDVDVARIAERILRADIDVLGVQEVEDIAVLREFNRTQLGGLYSDVALVEGNDARFIDIGVMSKLPLGAVTSHQAAVHPEDPVRRIFSRDLLEVEILDPTRSRRLLTTYITHLKSKFVPFGEEPEETTRRSDERRRRQAETIATIVAGRQRPDGRFVVLGDMNDESHNPSLAALAHIEGQAMVDGLAHPVETRPAPADASGQSATPRWTHRYKPSGVPAEYTLFDQLWLSRTLGARQTGAFIDRRIRLTGDGSDHDPAWVTLDV